MVSYVVFMPICMYRNAAGLLYVYVRKYKRSMLPFVFIMLLVVVGVGGFRLVCGKKGKKQVALRYTTMSK